METRSIPFSFYSFFVFLKWLLVSPRGNVGFQFQFLNPVPVFAMQFLVSSLQSEVSSPSAYVINMGSFSVVYINNIISVCNHLLIWLTYLMLKNPYQGKCTTYVGEYSVIIENYSILDQKQKSAKPSQVLSCTNCFFHTNAFLASHLSFIPALSQQGIIWFPHLQRRADNQAKDFLWISRRMTDVCYNGYFWSGTHWPPLSFRTF